MAIQPRQLKATRVLKNVKDYHATLQTPELYAASATITAPGYTVQEAAAMSPAKVGNLLPPLTPLYFDTAATPPAWKQWVDGQNIEGFAIGKNGLSLGETGMVELSDAGEVIALVMKGGQVPYDQIPLTPGQTADNLKAALRDGMRSRGFDILNLDNVH